MMGWGIIRVWWSVSVALLALAILTAVPNAVLGQDANQTTAAATIQSNPAPTDADQAAAAQAPAMPGEIRIRQSDQEFELKRRSQEIEYSSWISILSLIAGGAFLVAFAGLLYSVKFTPEIARLFIVIVVIVSAILLIVMGYNEQQVAPAFALLGTILGYLFGRMTSDQPTAGAASASIPSPDATPAAGPASQPTSP